MIRSISLLLCVAFLGCSSEQLEPVYPVSGTVTQKGKPVSGAIVAFTPAESGKGLAASATTDDAGVYRLTTRSSSDGAAAGKYKVSIAKYDKKLEPAKTTSEPSKPSKDYDITNEYPTGYNEMQASEIAASLSKNLLPAKYANPDTSKLQVDVTKGKNQHDFSID